MNIQEHLSRNLLVGELLSRNARKYPGKMGFKEGERSFTYAEYNFRVNKLSNALSGLGIGHGDKVAMLLFNGIEMVDCYFALAKLGAVCVPVNFRFIGTEIAYVVDNSDSVAMIFDKSFEKIIASIKDRMPKLKHFIVVPFREELPYALNYDEFLSMGSGEEPNIMVNDNDVAQIMYTSGTTGKPKGAVLSHKNQLMNALSFLVERYSNPDEIYLSNLPLFHVAGIGTILHTLSRGGSIIISKEFNPGVVAETIEKEKVTVLLMVPAMWNMLLQLPNVQKYDFSSLRACLTGAAIMPLKMKESILKNFPNMQLYDGFGQTEMSPVTTLLKPEDFLRKPTSVGKPIIGVEVRVVDDGGQDVPQGEIGEIIYRGPGMFLEYYKNPEATRQALVDGWFHSGDLVRMDEEGFVYVVDRKKDMIISGGENVYPAEVEEVLYGHEKIMEAAVIGIPSEKWGEGVHAIVVAKPGQTLTAGEVIEYCASNLAGYKKPRSVDIVDTLPRNASGKVLKTKLREIYGSAIKY